MIMFCISICLRLLLEKIAKKIGPDGLPGLTGKDPFAIFIAWSLWIFAN